MSKKEKAFELFDEANAQDPNQDSKLGRSYPKELLYAERMTEMLTKFEPNASEVVRLAARAQHLKRWEIPRKKYPMNRVGYLKWRTDLKDFHAEQAGSILMKVGYSNNVVIPVRALIRKEGLKSNPEMQLLEDVICLVFLQYYLEDFAKQHEESKAISILQKTWKKMSEKGQKFLRSLTLSGKCSALLKKALEE